MATKWILSLTFLLVIFCGGIIPAKSQSLESLLERYTGDNASGYIEPLVTAFGANLNSGLFYSADIPKGGFHLNLRLNVMLATFSDNQKTYTARTESFFTPPREAETATIVGPGQGAVVEGAGGARYVFPGGYDLNALALVVPTITVGNFLGTEVSGRYFSTRIDEDIGKVTLVGFGIRHSISQYIPRSPVDWSIGFAFNNFKIGDIVKNDLIFVHTEVGKSFSIIDLYGGLAIEKNRADVHYTFTAAGQEEEVNIKVKGQNTFRAFAGFSLNLLVLHLNVDYNIGQQNLVNAGISLGL